MKKILFSAVVLACLFTENTINAQSLQWLNVTGGSGDEEHAVIAVDPSGNVWSAGTFNDTVDFDPGAGSATLVASGGSDIFIQKLDAAGNFLWVSELESTANLEETVDGLCTDSYGNLYVTGTFKGTMDFDPGAGVYPLTANGTPDIFILKLDPAGNFIRAQKISSSSNGYAAAIACDSLDNILLAGDFTGTADFDPGASVFNLSAGTDDNLFVLKLDSSGAFIWAKNVPTMVYNKISMGIDSLANVLVTGNFSGTVDFDPGAGTYNISAVGGTDVFILKLDMGGNFAWATSIGSQGPDVSADITVDEAGYVTTMGLISGIADMDPGTATHTLDGADGHLFFQKLDNGGNYIWARQIDAFPASITHDSMENLYVFGGFKLTCDLNPGGGLYNLHTSGPIDMFLLKLKPSGMLIGAGQMGGQMDQFPAQVIVHGMDIYTTGSYEGTVDLNPTGLELLSTAAGKDIFVQKLNHCTALPLTPDSIDGNTEVCRASLQTYFVPADPTAFYYWNMPSGIYPFPYTISSSINVYPDSGGVILVRAFNFCGVTGFTSLAITVDSLPVPPVSQNGSVLTTFLGMTDYQWYRNGGAIAGATNQNFTLSDTGHYYVIVTDGNGCSGQSASLAVLTLGIGDPAAFGDLLVYPNPGKGSFTISGAAAAGEQDIRLELMDLQGKRLLQEDLAIRNGRIERKVERSGLTPGIYFMKISSGKRSQVVQYIVH